VPYHVWANLDVPSGTDFNNMFADPVSADITTSETTTATSYGDLATVGPSVTLSMSNGQAALVFLSTFCTNSIGGGHTTYMSFAITGAGTLSAADVNGVGNDTTGFMTLSRTTVVIVGATGSFTFTAKYKVSVASTGTFQMRRLMVKKL
jgi:hypothetical protein